MNEDWDDEDDYDEFDSFSEGDGVIIETNSNVEVGLFVGVSKEGLIIRATHRAVPEIDAETGGPMIKPLARTILTFIPWRRVEKIELKAEWDEEIQTAHFINMLSQVDDDVDLVAMVELESSDDDERLF